ncbi:MAG: glycoside hydrolase family 27 protein [Acidobacteriaceae bacterium]|nr:glycoside hydrolase family 27 protein [Acidobacteriaceae bacterium]
MLRLAQLSAVLLSSLLPAQTLAPTPPMGWNSWDSYGLSVTQDEFKANAEYLAKNLLRYGWEYAVVDEGWYLQNPEGKAGTFRFTTDANGRYTPALNRFPAGNRPGFTDLADWVHARKMKFGIHIIRGIPREAVEKNLPIAGSRYRAAEAANKSDTCKWNADNYGLKANAAGQAYYDSIAALYASWGVDYVKIDCISYPYLDDEIHMFSAALRKTGRPIALSLSPGPTPLDKADDVKNYAQLWRISGDVWDHWNPLPGQAWTQGLLAQFQLMAKWAPYAGAGHWPDADMLPIGYIGPRPGFEKARTTNFTHDECRTLLTLWSIARSPLMMGGNLTKMDDWTNSLLTNEEVLAVDQRSTGGREVVNDGKKAVWIAKAGTRDTFYIALFNLTDAPQTVAYPLQSISMSRTSGSVRNLWEHKDLGTTDVLKAQLPPHAAALFRLRP